MVTSSIKKIGDVPALQVNYLFKAFYNKNGQLEGRIRPLPNITFAAQVPIVVMDNGNPKKYEQIKPMSTNFLGMINYLSADFNDATRIRALTKTQVAKKQKLFFPTPEDLSYIYAAKGDKWVETLRDGFSEAQKKGLKEDKALEMIREEISFDQLEKPLTNKQLALKLNKSDAEIEKDLNQATNLINTNQPKFKSEDLTEDIIYRAWYDYQDKIENKLFHGYIMKQSRFIIFSFSHSDAPKWEVSFGLKGKNKVSGLIKPIDMGNGLSMAVYQGSPYELLNGFYEIEITLGDINPKAHWNSQHKKSNTYTLIEKFRFNIKNISGEYELVNCDPITVEECLMKQHSTQFAHLLEAAMKDDKKEKSTDKKKTKASDPALVAMAHDLKIVKTKADYVRGVMSAHDERSRMKITGDLIVKAMFSSGVNKEVVESVKLGFNVKEFQYQLFNDLQDTYEKLGSDINLKGASIAEILSESKKMLKVNWQNGFPSADELPDDTFFQSTAGWFTSRYNLPEAGVRRLLGRMDKFSTVLDGAINIYDTAQVLNKYFYESIDDLTGKEKQHSAVFQDYHQQISDWDEQTAENLKKDIEAHNSSFKPNENGTYALTILFDFSKFDVLEKNIHLQVTKRQTSADNKQKNQQNASKNKAYNAEQAIQALVTLMQAHPEVHIKLEAYTDPVGSLADNQILSESRALAVKDKIVSAGISAEKIQTIGHGEKNLIVDAQGNIDAQASRRVVAVIDYLGMYQYLPSREGLMSLEQARHATVMSYQGHKNAEAELASKAWDWVKAGGAVIPHLRVLTALVAVAETSYGLAKNALALIDDVLLNKFFAQEIAQYKQLKSYHSSSNANQILLRETFEKEKNDANMLYLQTQYKIRAEAIYGLIGLITRAAVGASDEEDYLIRFKKYQIPAYIENFILNDHWLFEMKPSFPLTMDEYWTFAVNTASLLSDENKAWFDLDDNYRLKNDPNTKTLDIWGRIIVGMAKQVDTHLDIASALLDIFGFASHQYSLAGKEVPAFQRADFTRCFPVHHLSSSNNFKELAGNFLTNFDFLGDEIYEHTCIYARKKDSKAEADWQLLSDYRKVKGGIRAISPLDQIRILIVLKEDEVKDFSVLPASIQLTRMGFFTILGPIYKALIRPLMDSELIGDEKKKYTGKMGCVVYPIFQFGKLTFCGTKPITTQTQLTLSARPYALPKEFEGSEGLEEGFDYWRSGGLDEMSYQFDVRIGSSDNTKHVIRIEGSEDDPEGEYEVTVAARKTLGGRKTRRGIRGYQYEWQPDAFMLYGPFLVSNTSEANVPALFEEDPYLMVLIRIGGENGQYICPSEPFQDSVKNASTPAVKMQLLQGITKEFATLQITEFDWDTSVEFMFVASTSSINKKSFKEAGMPWNRMAFSTQLAELTGMDTKGFKISTTLRYLGTLKRSSMFANYIFDDSDKAVSKQEKFKPIIKLLQEPGDKANLLAGSYKDFVKDNERHVFAAYYRCRYENLLGVAIDSIRPFGSNSKFGKDRILSSKEQQWQKQVPFKYAFKDAFTGDGSIDQSWIKHLNFFTTEFHFTAPTSYFDNVPWIEAPDNADELLELARKNAKQTPLTEWQLKTKEEKENAIKEWIEKDTQAVKYTKITAFKE